MFCESTVGNQLWVLDLTQESRQRKPQMTTQSVPARTFAKVVLTLAILLGFARFVGLSGQLTGATTPGKALAASSAFPANEVISVRQVATGNKTDQGSDEVAELIKLDRQWVEAGRRHGKDDIAFLDQLFTDDFVGSSIGAGGVMMNKSQIFKNVNAPERKLHGEVLDDIQVHLYNGDTAIVTDHQSNQGIIGGRNITAEYRTMRVFVKQQGRWRAAASLHEPMTPSAYTPAQKNDETQK
jgi:hypothetical protein